MIFTLLVVTSIALVISFGDSFRIATQQRHGRATTGTYLLFFVAPINNLQLCVLYIPYCCTGSASKMKPTILVRSKILVPKRRFQ